MSDNTASSTATSVNISTGPRAQGGSIEALRGELPSRRLQNERPRVRPPWPPTGPHLRPAW